ncbi:C45 family autoproteolytic acyltransferase/hydolase [Selenomonas sp. KH1T6]|uniref:C45 family autoproteolytic acyltransferase/hydolase n=1 Tax=Selenomonas sp. KH1T6 TaxID=3158784 RepID=UPI0008A78D22|nr:Acyl-coenzyme A:6-aminopenicillanic acid acyl-transferase [Selenomonas ruminantium]
MRSCTWKRRIIAGILAAGIAMSAIQVEACTLFAAQGDCVAGGGTLIAKNRDEIPAPQKAALVENGRYRYYGIFTKTAKGWGLRGGVNEEGLAVFSATASAIPKELRSRKNSVGVGALHRMLSRCGSVEEALQKKECFRYPQFLMLADAREIAYVEIGMDDFRIRRMKNGTLVHTNHFLEHDMQKDNLKSLSGSMKRYERMKMFLDGREAPYDMDDFICFSEDPKIWRKGKDLRTSQTLAVMAVHIQENSIPEIYVKMRREPGDAGREEVVRVAGEEVFE